MKLRWKEWFEAAFIRAVRTMAETALAVIGTSAMMSDVNWIAVLSSCVLSGILAMLWALKGLPEVNG